MAAMLANYNSNGQFSGFDVDGSSKKGIEALSGPSMGLLRAHNMDINALRPILHEPTGVVYVNLKNGFDDNGEQKWKVKIIGNVENAPSAVSYRAWEYIDQAVATAAVPQFRVIADLERNGMTFDVPKGLGTMEVVTQNRTRSGNAQIGMSPLGRADRVRPEVTNDRIPTPIIFADTSFDVREVMVTQGTGMQLDTTAIEDETREVVVLAEKLHLGLQTFSYNGNSLYGMINYPYIYTGTMSLPTGGSWTPDTAYNQFLAMLQTLHNDFWNGPFGVYYSPGWFQYLMKDYSAIYPGYTLMRKLMEIKRLQFIEQADFLTDYKVLIYSLNSSVMRTLKSLPLSVFQWETHAGWQWNLKIMMSRNPNPRRDSNSKNGIMYAAAA